MKELEKDLQLGSRAFPMCDNFFRTTIRDTHVRLVGDTDRLEQMIFVKVVAYLNEDVSVCKHDYDADTYQYWDMK